MTYGPTTILTNEGLGRHIANLIKGFMDANHEICVACPEWSLDTLDDLLIDFQVEKEKIEFMTATTKGTREAVQDDKLQKYILTKEEESVADSLATQINQDDSVGVWFVPTLYWPEIEKINKIKVIVAPDLMAEDYPLNFANIDVDLTMDYCRKVLKTETYFITYCEYLKYDFLVDRYGKMAQNIKSIPHITNDMSHSLFLDGLTQDEIEEKACVLLEEACKKSMLTQPESLPSGKNLRYIFFPSQFRPQKNILTLVKAYHYLKAKEKVSYKLVLTAHPEHDNTMALQNYIKTNQLEENVLFLYNLTGEELSAVYYRADLVVNPVLYEGGFPFTLGEGMSVGTPSVMSRIPQVEDVISPWGLAETMLFDPYDWKSMAQKIKYAVEHRTELYKMQLPLYEHLKKRTPAEGAAEYVEAFQYFQRIHQ